MLYTITFLNNNWLKIPIFIFFESKHLETKIKDILRSGLHNFLTEKKVLSKSKKRGTDSCLHFPQGIWLARLESGHTFAAAQCHSKTCTASDAGEEKEQNTQWRRRRQRRAGRARGDRPPAQWAVVPQWDERRTVVHPLNSGKVQRQYPSSRRCDCGSESTTRRWASRAASPLICTMARVALPQWSANALFSCLYSKLTIA